MEKELFLKASPDADGHRVTIEAGEGVDDKVLMRFVDGIDVEGAGDLLGYYDGQKERFKSTYNKKWYELYRKSEYRFLIQVGS